MKAPAIALAALLAAAPALAQTPASAYPHLAVEVNLGLFGVHTFRDPEQARRGTSAYLFGEIAAGLHLAPGWSIQGVLAFEPIGEGDVLGGTPGGGFTLFRRQAAFLEALFLEYRPSDRWVLYGGRFVAPFGRGQHDFPGILTRLRAHEVTLLGDSLGVGATWTFLSDPRFGEHDLSAALFTLDRTVLSSTLFTRRACCDERYERFRRTTAAQGGPANSGRLDSFSLSLDGDRFPWAPGLSYTLGLSSRAPGADGTAREWGVVAGLRYEYRWADGDRTLLFAEHAMFRNAGGRPLVVPEDPLEQPFLLRETRHFTTLGVQHRRGAWRGTLAWQRDGRTTRPEPTPTEQYLELSVGRDLGGGFALDVGYQYGRSVREETGRLGTGHAVLLRLGYSGGF
jgi:hypothetical protein